MKKCVQCKREKSIKEFTKNKNNKDGLSKICKECASINNRNYREKQIAKYGKKEYLAMEWEKTLRYEAQKIGISLIDFNEEKVDNLCFPMIEYPDRSFPYSLGHLDFCLKYNLSINEYLFLREKIESGNFYIK